MIPSPHQSEPEALAKRTAAVNFVAENFSAGIAEICDPHFLAKRYQEFLSRDDPIYVNLLQGMDDDALEKTFVSYWTVAQTMATQSRFWLEDAVAEIITSQVKHFGRPAAHVYSQRMLGQNYWEKQVAVMTFMKTPTSRLA